MKKCEVCGKRAEGLGTYPVVFGSATLCSNCYETMAAFKNGRKFTKLDDVKERKAIASEEMKTKQFPQHVIEEINAYFNTQEKVLEGKIAAIRLEKGLDTFMMTTGHTFEGYKITAYHGVVSGESVLGTGFMSSWDASWSDTFGVESMAFMDKLKEARNGARKRLVQACVEVGGNALIGVDIEYTMFFSNMIGVIFNGTSVTVEKI